MKKLVLVSLVLFSFASASEALARENCRRQNNSCSQGFQRSEIFKELLKIEGGDTRDAQSNLQLIESTARDLRIDIYTSAANFIYLQNILGGNGYTATTQSTFKILSGYVTRYTELADVVDQFEVILKAEGGDNQDALAGLKLATTIASQNQLRLAAAVNMYLNLLHSLGGKGYTATTAYTFQKINDLGNHFPLHEKLWAFEDLLEAEGGDNQDALSDLTLVYKGGVSCGSLKEALDEFISILQTVGGKGYTATAQKTYRDLFGL